MGELSRDLMRGEGGLDALNGGLDGNLGQWAEGEAIGQTAGRQAPQATGRQAPRRGPAAPRRGPFPAAVAAIALVGLILILLALATL